MRQRLEHARRRQQRAEILERNVHAGDLAQKRVDLVRGDVAHVAARGAILEQAAARQLPQQRDRGRKARRADLLDGGLAALGAKRQRDALAVDGDVRLQQRGRAARAAQARIAFGARPDGAARHQLDHRSRGEFARRRVAGEMLGDAAADARQHVGEPRQTPRLANLAHLLPVGMIAVLQPAGGVAPDGLQMRGRDPARRARRRRRAAWRGAPAAAPWRGRGSRGCRDRDRSSPCRTGGGGSPRRRRRRAAGPAASPRFRRRARHAGGARPRRAGCRGRWRLHRSRFWPV